MSEKNLFEGSPSSQQPERKLTPEELRERLRDPSHLPTHGDVSRVFKSERFFSQEWFDFCFDKKHPIFEFLNEEHLNALSDYLSERAESLGAREDELIIILEVGAGDGRMTHFLQQKLEERIPGKVKVIATDSGKWKIEPTFPVEIIDHNKDALIKHKPKIVVCSWMPYQEDWTADFRAIDSVEEYILIGETDGGCCGDEWRTWGFAWFNEKEGQPLPYEADGFERIDLDDISKHQISRTDPPGEYYHSRTTSFRRKK